MFRETMTMFECRPRRKKSEERRQRNENGVKRSEKKNERQGEREREREKEERRGWNSLE